MKIVHYIRDMYERSIDKFYFWYLTEIASVRP